MSDLVSKMGLITKVKFREGVQYILNEAYAILGNPLLAYDMDYKIIAHTENVVTDDPFWNESEATGMIGHDSLLLFRDETFSEVAAGTNRITFLLSDKLKYDRVFGKLFTSNHIQVGYACAVASDKPFEDGDAKLLEAICGILNQELCANVFYQNYGQAYLEKVVGDLIEGNREDTGLISHVESVYIGLKDFLRLAVVDIGQSDPTYAELAYFRDRFKKTRPHFKYAIYSQTIVCFFSSDHSALDVESTMKLYMVFEQNNLHAGMSNCFENLYELSKYYHQAVQALRHGLEHNRDQRIFLYDDSAV